ncbi:aconitase X catalytic domain-containing protein [Arenibaculum sp.]|uniref:aconitase X catalytic domain-containing protein n=1 Tax=Arenibaculum sp. TaxID=2865862 RepID=UPI002E142A3F|nr:aconitase X catalytic domain-containing protein [Arenibaculum sp.]
MELTAEERRMAAGEHGEALGIATRIVAEAGRLLGADRLVPVASAHIDGCLYHGDGGVLFAERLVAAGGRTAVPATLNVGALDLLHPGRVRFDAHRAAMARRLMDAHLALGCRPTWTCAPYQAGHRPALGEHVAWGESNAVAFANSVLGARTNRLGDFLDVSAALCGRAPHVGLHLDANRKAALVVDASGLSPRLVGEETFWPVLGAWLGAEAGSDVTAVDGLPPGVAEDRLKAMGAAAASTGAVALFHVVGSTPEAPTLAAVAGDGPVRRVKLTSAMLRGARDRLSTAAADGSIDAVAIGSPHLSERELARLAGLVAGRSMRVPFYACVGRGVLETAERRGLLDPVRAAGITIVADTCVVVAPVLPRAEGVLMTNSGKFAHYGPANTGHATVFGSLEDCIASAEAGRVLRDEEAWS